MVAVYTLFDATIENFLSHKENFFGALFSLLWILFSVSRGRLDLVAAKCSFSLAMWVGKFSFFLFLALSLAFIVCVCTPLSSLSCRYSCVFTVYFAKKDKKTFLTWKSTPAHAVCRSHFQLDDVILWRKSHLHTIDAPTQSQTHAFGGVHEWKTWNFLIHIENVQS